MTKELKSYWGEQINAPYTKKAEAEKPATDEGLPPGCETLDDFIEQIEHKKMELTEVIMDPYAPLNRREQAQRDRDRLFEKFFGNVQVSGSAQMDEFSSGHSRIVGESGAPGKAGAVSPLPEHRQPNAKGKVYRKSDSRYGMSGGQEGTDENR